VVLNDSSTQSWLLCAVDLAGSYRRPRWTLHSFFVGFLTGRSFLFASGKALVVRSENRSSDICLYSAVIHQLSHSEC
jgi:hypothetical protein